MSAQCRWVCGLVLLSVSLSSWAAAPQLFGSAYNEGPVRGDPDDLLLLPGYPLGPADTVVYQSVADTTAPLSPPLFVPVLNSAASGVADPVSVADLPYSLAVHLPPQMSAGQSYALWAQDGAGNWSNGVLINDARPLWFTPDTVYQNAATAGLPRVLKIVGRNLQPAPGAVTQVKLVGPVTYTLGAASPGSDPTMTTALQRYVAKVQLPGGMAAGSYSVQLSRDGVSWVPLAGNSPFTAQTLTVQADPVTPASFAVSDPAYGGCQPNLGQDVTPCLQSAVNAAYAAGGGTVTLGAGTWQMLITSIVTDGIILPPGVGLQGAGSGATILERGAGFPSWAPSFALTGRNTVQGITFRDDAVYTPSSWVAPMLQLGLAWYWKNSFAYHAQDAQAAKQLSGVVITGNTFDKPFFAVGSGALPTDHVYITNNVFGGAYSTALYIANDPNYANDPDSIAYPYQFSDAVVAYNTFYPSSYVSADYTQGVLASQIATTRRLDFSNNTADGTATQYFYNPATDPKGWRAAWFWSSGQSQEMTLVAQNNASCTGDKAGDGEAISYDGSTEWGGFAGPQPSGAPPPGAGAVPVVSAAASTVTVLGTLVGVLPTTNGNGPTTIPPAYYKGFWLQFVQGPGLGQWRRVSDVATGTDGSGNSTVTFTVAPAFDVLPRAGSQLILNRAYWQNATVSNFVDQRQPLCTKANPLRPSGGTITWYASTGDSAMEGNEQHDTNGILLNHVYRLPGLGSSPQAPSFSAVIQSSNEVRNNLVDGEYQWSAANSASGLQLGYGATADTAAPPVLGFATTVAGNTINHADTANYQPSVNQSVGALGLGPNWSTGPLDAKSISGWKMADANLLFHNTLSNIAYSGSDGLDRLGIGLDREWGTSTVAPIAWRSVLYGNSCGNNVSTLLNDAGTGTVYYCPAVPAGSCECAAAGAIVDIGLRVNSAAAMVGKGAGVTYLVSVNNFSGGPAGTGVTVAIEPPAGIQLTALSPNNAGVHCDIATYTCTIASMPSSGSGSAFIVRVSGTAVAAGSWPLLFTVTHQEADTNIANDAAEFNTTVTP